MKQCDKCLVFFTPPLLAHRNSYAFSHCNKCCDEYYKILIDCTKKAMALSSGFKLKEQPNGEMDLNPYFCNESDKNYEAEQAKRAS